MTKSSGVGILDVGDSIEIGVSNGKPSSFWASSECVILAQKLFAEFLGTYIMIFAGCGSVVVHKLYDEVVTFPGICITWGLIVMVMIYTVGHISGAHFNPSVTITLTIFKKFPYKEAPLYILAQVMGSTFASVTLCIMFDITSKEFFGTTPSGTNAQSFAAEVIVSFILMFVVSGVGSDSRARGELAGVAVGMTVLLNCLVAGPISGASMNPARTLGPAFVRKTYKGLWIYMIAPPLGTTAGAFCYNLLRFTDKSLHELTKGTN